MPRETPQQTAAEARLATPTASGTVSGYFGPDHSLWGCLHCPSGTPRELGVVLCAPPDYEGVQAYRAMRVMAVRLAERGLPTLRFDYHGTGESLGDNAQPGRVQAWLDSVQAAIAELREASGVAKVCLVGVRLGATLAGEAAAREAVDALVLWDPCLTGALFLREMAIMNAGSTQSQDSDEDGPIEAGGYLITAETQKDMAGLNLMKAELQGAPDVLLVHREDRPAPKRFVKRLQEGPSDATVRAQSGIERMLTRPDKSQVPEEVFGCILDWIDERAGAGSAAGSQSRLREATASSEAACRVARFGEGGRLFGVLTQPPEGAGPGLPTVVFLTGGTVPRTALNRMYTRWSGTLVAEGYRTFRMDASGIGESLQKPGVLDHDPYPPSLIDDVRAGLSWLRSETGSRDFCLVGLCSGAFAGFQASLLEPDVTSLVLLSPLAWHWQNPMPTDETEAQALGKYLKTESGAGLRNKVVQVLKDPERLARAAKKYGGMLGGAALDPVKKALASRDPLAKNLKSLVDRGVRISVCFAHGDPGHEAMLARAPKPIEQYRAAGKLDLHVLEGGDHIFSGLEASAEVFDWLRPRIGRA